MWVKAPWTQNAEIVESSSGKRLGPQMDPKIQHLLSETMSSIRINWHKN